MWVRYLISRMSLMMFTQCTTFTAGMTAGRRRWWPVLPKSDFDYRPSPVELELRVPYVRDSAANQANNTNSLAPVLLCALHPPTAFRVIHRLPPLGLAAFPSTGGLRQSPNAVLHFEVEMSGFTLAAGAPVEVPALRARRQRRCLGMSARAQTAVRPPPTTHTRRALGQSCAERPQRRSLGRSTTRGLLGRAGCRGRRTGRKCTARRTAARPNQSGAAAPPSWSRRLLLPPLPPRACCSRSGTAHASRARARRSPRAGRRRRQPLTASTPSVAPPAWAVARASHRRRRTPSRGHSS